MKWPIDKISSGNSKLKYSLQQKDNHQRKCTIISIIIGVRGGGSLGAAAPGLENFQGKLCLQGKRKLL